jgi:adenylate cyclase
VAQSRITRKLTAILAADIVGYSRLMGAAEEDTLERLEACRHDLIDPRVAEHRGRIFKTMGDGFLAEFASVVDAVRCAVAIQRAMAARNVSLAPPRRMDFRIGINLGDVMALEDDIYGDGVNVAARLEGLADPGGICLSQTVVDQVRDKLDLAFEDLGERRVKNIARPVRAWRLRLDGSASSPPGAGAVPAAPGRRTAWLRAASLAALLAAVGAIGLWRWADRGIDSELMIGGPSIAVTPFVNSSGEVQLTSQAQAMTEDIVTQLGQVTALKVVPLAQTGGPNASNDPAHGEPVRIGRDLKVRYLLTGSVRTQGQEIRLSVQLVETASGFDCWTARYDFSAADPTKARDDIMQDLTTQLIVQMRNRDLQLAKKTPVRRLDSYGLYLLGKEALARDDLHGLEVARSMFGAAIAANPAYAPAIAGEALIALRELKIGRSGLSLDAALDRMFALAQSALKLGPGTSDAQEVVANVYLYRHQYSQAIDLLQQEINASADDSGLRETLGDVHVFAGDAGEGISVLDELMRLDPFHDQAIFGIYARAYILQRQGEKAIANAEFCMGRAPEYRPCFDAAVVAYEEGGQGAKAADALAQALSLDPRLSLAALREALPFKRGEDIQRFDKALGAAGLK